jgi:hypothetical protein
MNSSLVDLSFKPLLIIEPTVPKTIMGKPVLSGAGLEGFIPAFGPGEFVIESGHRSRTPFTEAMRGSDSADYSIPLQENSKDPPGLRISPEGKDTA